MSTDPGNDSLSIPALTRTQAILELYTFCGWGKNTLGIQTEIRRSWSFVVGVEDFLFRRSRLSRRGGWDWQSGRKFGGEGRGGQVFGRCFRLFALFGLRGGSCRTRGRILDLVLTRRDRGVLESRSSAVLLAGRIRDRGRQVSCSDAFGQ